MKWKVNKKIKKMQEKVKKKRKKKKMVMIVLKWKVKMSRNVFYHSRLISNLNGFSTHLHYFEPTLFTISIF